MEGASFLTSWALGSFPGSPSLIRLQISKEIVVDFKGFPVLLLTKSGPSTGPNFLLYTANDLTGHNSGRLVGNAFILMSSGGPKSCRSFLYLKSTLTGTNIVSSSSLIADASIADSSDTLFPVARATRKTTFLNKSNGFAPSELYLGVQSRFKIFLTSHLGTCLRFDGSIRKKYLSRSRNSQSPKSTSQAKEIGWES